MTDRFVIEGDAETRLTMIVALELFARVSTGQWRDVVEHAPGVLRDAESGVFGPVGDGLTMVRCEFAADPSLRHPNASLAIRQAGRSAVVAYDAWMSLLAMNVSDRSDRITGALCDCSSLAGGRFEVVVDDEARGVMVAALDLLQRVAMGQWRALLDVAGGLLSDGARGPAGEALMAVRCSFAKRVELGHPATSLGIRQSGRSAEVAYDVWHCLGGGMVDRRSDRITDVEVSVNGRTDGVL